jgi:hypothetical protein
MRPSSSPRAPATIYSASHPVPRQRFGAMRLGSAPELARSRLGVEDVDGVPTARDRKHRRVVEVPDSRLGRFPLRPIPA